jgi:hypothetical protein
LTQELAVDRSAPLCFRHLQDAFILAVANCVDDSVYRINALEQSLNRGGLSYIYTMVTALAPINRTLFNATT